LSNGIEGDLSDPDLPEEVNQVPGGRSGLR